MSGSWLPRQDVQANGGEPVPTPDAIDFRDSATVAWTVSYDEATGAARVSATVAGFAAAIGGANEVLKVNAAGTALEYGKLTTANIHAAAGIVGSQLSAAAGIVGTQLAAGANILGSQLSATAAIAATQLAAGAVGTVLIGGASNSFSATPTVTSLAATSYLTAGSGTKATAGEVRFPSAWSIKQRNAEPGTVDRDVLSGTGEALTVGSAAQTGNTKIWGATGSSFVELQSVDLYVSAPAVRLQASGVTKMSITAGETSMSVGLFTFAETLSGPIFKHNARSTDAATTALTVEAQSAWVSATGTNRNGGHLDLKAGTKATGGTDGQVRIYSGGGWLGAQIANGQVSFYGSTEIDFFMGGVSRTLLDVSAWRLKNGCQLRWDNENTAPEIAHSVHTTDTAPGNLTLKPQAPWASATGANRTPGSLIVALAAPTGGGANDAAFKITRGGTFAAQIAPLDSAPTTYTALWLTPATAPTTSNFSIAHGAGTLYFNTATSHALIFGGSATTGMAITSTVVSLYPAAVQWDKSVASPNITHNAQTTDVACTDLTIQAQSPWASATTNNKGAKLWLRGGNTGTGEGNAPGSVWIGAGATTVASFEAAQVSLYANYLEFRHDTASPEIRQQARQSDLAAYNLLIQAQSAYSGASTNKDGGHLVLKGGARYTSGTDGGVQLKGGDGTTVFQIDMAGGARIGFYGATPAAKPTVTGSRGGNAALASLLTALSGQGLLTDSSS